MTFSSKCFLCKPSGMVRFSKSGGLILVNTTFILFSWGEGGCWPSGTLPNLQWGVWSSESKHHFIYAKRQPLRILLQSLIKSSTAWTELILNSWQNKAVGRTSPGRARWLRTMTGDLARPTSGGSSAKVGTEMEWVELSGTRSEHMSFRWAKTLMELWEKTHNKSSLSPQCPLTWKPSWTKRRSEDL